MDQTACIDLPAFPLQLLLRKHPDWREHPAGVVEADGDRCDEPGADEFGVQRRRPLGQRTEQTFEPLRVEPEDAGLILAGLDEGRETPKQLRQLRNLVSDIGRGDDGRARAVDVVDFPFLAGNDGGVAVADRRRPIAFGVALRHASRHQDGGKGQQGGTPAWGEEASQSHILLR